MVVEQDCQNGCIVGWLEWLLSRMGKMVVQQDGQNGC